jgi:hypothetical protein
MRRICDDEYYRRLDSIVKGQSAILEIARILGKYVPLILQDLQ